MWQVLASSPAVPAPPELEFQWVQSIGGDAHGAISSSDRPGTPPEVWAAVGTDIVRWHGFSDAKGELSLGFRHPEVGCLWDRAGCVPGLGFWVSEAPFGPAQGVPIRSFVSNSRGSIIVLDSLDCLFFVDVEVRLLFSWDGTVGRLNKWLAGWLTVRKVLGRRPPSSTPHAST